MTALTKLESRDYHQGKKVVDDYIDEFSELVDEAGYMRWPLHRNEILERSG